MLDYISNVFEFYKRIQKISSTLTLQNRRIFFYSMYNSSISTIMSFRMYLFVRYLDLFLIEIIKILKGLNE